MAGCVSFAEVRVEGPRVLTQAGTPVAGEGTWRGDIFLPSLLLLSAGEQLRKERCLSSLGEILSSAA